MENKNEVIKTEEELYYPATEVSNNEFKVTPKVVVGAALAGAGAAVAIDFIIAKLKKRRIKKALKKFKDGQMDDVEVVEVEAEEVEE